MTETYFDYVEKEREKNPELDTALKDYELQQAIARLDELGNYGFRPPIQYVRVLDSLAWVRQDLDIVKKHIAMLEKEKTHE